MTINLDMAFCAYFWRIEKIYGELSVFGAGRGPGRVKEIFTFVEGDTRIHMARIEKRL